MAKSTRDAHLHELATRGAEARMKDLLAEAKLLFRHFPQLRDSFDPDELPVSFLLAAGRRSGTRKAPARRGPGLSPAARAAASERMKKYWARRRRARGSKG